MEAFALTVLGISGTDFWLLSPRRFAILAETWARRDRALQENADRRAAVVAAVTYNRPGVKHARRVSDFMPSRRERAPQRQSVQQQLRVMQQWAALTKGRNQQRHERSSLSQ